MPAAAASKADKHSRPCPGQPCAVWTVGGSGNVRGVALAQARTLFDLSVVVSVGRQAKRGNDDRGLGILD
jgi:hypothetical protein